MTFFAWLALAGALAAERQVAITLDDLPIAQSGPEACAPAELERLTGQILQHFDARKTPITGFVVGRQCPDLDPAVRKRVLQQWLRVGELGNHTWAHQGLNSVSSEEYHAGILKAEPGLREVMGKRPLRYFRSPMLHIGPTQEKKDALKKFLAEHGYQQAAVTIDNSDWLWANVYARAVRDGDQATAERVRREYVPYLESVTEWFEKRSVEVVGREIPQILLLHANRLNADMIGEVIAMLRRRGYKIVSLETALRDPAYQLPDGYVGTNGISWLHRWAAAKGLPQKWEPDEPKWVRDAFKAMQQQ